MNDLIDRQMVSYKLTDLVNEFEEILSHIREREENDSVCGLCEYDGAYMGQSGDWCNECPGFDKADCFKLKDKYKKEWLELMNTLPSVQPKLSNNSKELEKNSKELENKNGELISRQAAIDVLNRGLSKIPYVNNTDEEMIRRDERMCCIQEIRGLPSVQWIPCSDRLPEEGTEVLGTDDHGCIRHVVKDKSTLYEFATYEEMMHINIVAWMPLPEPWKEG